MERNKYPALDIIKFAFAILLVCAHYASEYGNFPTLLDMSMSLYIITVPFYFTSSAFLFFSKEEKKLKPYLVRVLKMYLGWSLIYFIFVLADWCLHGTDISSVLAYLHKSIVYTTYSTIWFLPALAVGIAMTYYISNKVNQNALIILAVCIYLIGSLGKSYSFLAEGTFVENIYAYYNKVFFTTRNGVFNAFPFCAIGYIIAKQTINKEKEAVKRDMALSFVFLCFIVGEGLLLKMVFHNSDENTIISLLPFTYFFFRLSIFIFWNASKACFWLRKTSTYIFTSQRIWLSAVPAISIHYKELISGNSYIGLFIVLVLTLAISVLLIVGSKKNKFIAILG